MKERKRCAWPGMRRVVGKGLVIGSVAAALAGGAFSAYAQVNAEQVLAIGRNVLSMEDYMLAIQYFNQAIKAKPYLADPYFFRALAKLNLEDYKGAEEDCAMAIDRNKFKTEAYKLRGFARQQLGRDSLAVADYDIGLDYNPTDRSFLFYKAVAQTDLKKYPEADSTFSTLLKLYPKFEEGFSARARLNVVRGDTVAALADLDRALSISKSLVNAYLMRAEIEAKRQNWEQASSDMDEAIRLYPQEPDLYVNRAFLRYNLDDFFGAMTDYNTTLEIDPHNAAALFNRALLRYEVKDLSRAAEDFSSVLALEPGNFHALYNRGLVYLELSEWKKALQDFNAISTQYPRFYPVYYAIAECRRNMGDMRGAMQNAYHGDELVKQYVKNPEKNALDRPTIAQATSNSSGVSQGEDESEIDVMNRFNQLVTVSETQETPLSFNDRMKGKVQDRNVAVEPAPLYAVTFTPNTETLRALSNYFRELDDLNTARYLQQPLYLSAGLPSLSSEEASAGLFAFADRIGVLEKQGGARPVDRMARGVALTSLKNFPEAIVELNGVIEEDPRFAVALMARGYALYAQAVSRLASPHQDTSSGETQGDAVLERRTAMKELSDAIADYDAALALNPRLVYAWFNKGCIYYLLQDFGTAAACFTKAVETDPDFGEAYFNRGLSHLKTGNKNSAFTDLSKAGELGVLPSYNLLKRMK
ncbi:MAG: tetratricopeptide repeat protein [Muribaculaceae bacterium]|nr:tetratricopeptide repeat protein [Muribaculaceae bacterium]